jgi:hypothetical protein
MMYNFRNPAAAAPARQLTRAYARMRLAKKLVFKPNTAAAAHDVCVYMLL